MFDSRGTSKAWLSIGFPLVTRFVCNRCNNAQDTSGQYKTADLHLGCPVPAAAGNGQENGESDSHKAMDDKSDVCS